MFLKIENPGFSDYRALTLLGVSTTRYAESEGTIGTFGTGFSQAISVLLRHGIQVVVFLDRLKLDFFTSDVVVSDNLSVTRNYQQISVRLSGKLPDGSTVNRTEDTGFTTEMGIRDWTEVAMGIREFVSNAIDRTIREGKKDTIYRSVSIVDDNQVRASAGYTRVFLPMNEKVREFHSTIGRRFLHFSEPESLNKRILPKRGRSLNNNPYPVFYKQGVFVREDSDNELPSVFDYNFGNELELDEARKVNDYAVRESAARCLREAEPEVIAEVLRRLIKREKVWESELSVSHYYWDEDRKNRVRANWQKAWEMVAGDAMLITADIDYLWRTVQNRGFSGVYIDSWNWRDALQRCGVKSDLQLAGIDDIKKGRTIEEPTSDVVSALNWVWDHLYELGMTCNREKPNVKMFDAVMQAEQQTHGYYRDGTVFIHKSISVGESDALRECMLEECVHHCTESSDLSRDMQSYLFKLAVAALKKNEETND